MRVKLISGKRLAVARGSFSGVYNARVFADLGIEFSFVQDNNVPPAGDHSVVALPDAAPWSGQAARAIQLVFEKAAPGSTYNVGGRAERTNMDVVQGVCDALDRLRPRTDGKRYSEQISFVTDRPGHDFRYAIDCSRLEDDLGWSQSETFETGLMKTVSWFLENEAWWRAILERQYTGERLGLKQP